MKTLRFHAILIALFLSALINCHAQQSVDVERAVNGIIQKYEKTKGVSSITFVKGKGLEMLKMMLNKEFGKEFMKGVTSITIIDYSDASERHAQHCTRIWTPSCHFSKNSTSAMKSSLWRMTI